MLIKILDFYNKLIFLHSKWISLKIEQFKLSRTRKRTYNIFKYNPKAKSDYLEKQLTDKDYKQLLISIMNHQ